MYIQSMQINAGRLTKKEGEMVTETQVGKTRQCLNTTENIEFTMNLKHNSKIKKKQIIARLNHRQTAIPTYIHIELICISVGCQWTPEHLKEIYAETQGEHANFIPKGLSWPTGYSPEPSCYKATVLTMVLPILNQN